MRNTIIIIAILVASSLKLFAGTYEETMGKNIAQLYQTQSRDELVAIGNTFDRIAHKEASQWLPYYYASYANLSVLFFAQNLNEQDKSSILDKAQLELDLAMKITDKESEIYVLQAFIYQMRINGENAYKFSTLSNEALAKAKTLNSENPRYYYLKGTNVFYTPAEFGGGKEAAKPLFEKAAELFDKVNQENILMPSWGSQHNGMLLQQCQ